MFLIHKWNKGAEPWEVKPAGVGLALDVGTALVIKSGVLAKATGTTKPEFICMEAVESTAEKQMVHVERVKPETEYETELSAASSAIAIGNKYTIDATGTMITATTDSGVATVTGFDGTAAGSKVRVRFI